MNQARKTAAHRKVVTEETYLKTKREAACYLGVSLASIERLMRSDLSYIKLSRGAAGAVRFHIDDLADFVASRRVKSACRGGDQAEAQ
jgi:hypothetical protein